jgi:glutathione-specific gamma-glutamylcyclotransferase
LPARPWDVLAMLLTRENLLSGELQRLVAQIEGIRTLSEEELQRSRALMLSRHAAGQDLWLFAYGSLIWNPAFHFVERRVARLHGYHRRFCLWTSLGRGTPERPGLMLGLDRGGSCAGVAYRIAADAVETELNVIWRREMVTGAYAPTWIRMRTTDGPIGAVTFLINHAHERYARRLCDEEVAAVVAVAEGRLGACRDYLFNTLQHLEDLGIRDHGLARVAQRVRQLRNGAETGESEQAIAGSAA